MRTRMWGTASLIVGGWLLLGTAARAQETIPAGGGPGMSAVAPAGAGRAVGDAWWKPLLPGEPATPAPQPDVIAEALKPASGEAVPQADEEAARKMIVRGQSFSPASPDYPIPAYREDIESGGFYTSFEYVMFRMTVPVSHQLIAIRGFFDASLGANAGQFHGSGDAALYADDASGPGTWMPGWKFGVGWKFADGTVIDLNWLHIHEYTYHAFANVVPFAFRLPSGNDADTFISSFVYNFGSDYSGPPSNPPNQYGIWNAANQMSVFFSQRYDQYDISWRETIMQDDMFRCYGLIGPRFAWIWERFLWRTVDNNAQFTELDVGVYNNIVSNRMYGVHFGTGSDWWLGNGFAATLEFQGTPYLDVVKEWAAYQLGDHLPLRRDKRSLTDWTMAGELEGSLALYWYPIQGVSARLGYNAMGFFNTKAAKDPVDFNLGAIAPPWKHEFFRLIHGFDVGFSITF